ncbi:MAG: hypothetical protein AAGG81_00850 [Chlamydiota bacterium]
MIINRNSYLQDIESLLTPSEDEKYIEINPKTRRCWRSSEKPDKTRVAEIFYTLNQELAERMSNKEFLSISELEIRVIYLESISQKVREFSRTFFSDVNSWYRTMFAEVSTEYRLEREYNQTKVENQYLLLKKTIKQYQQSVALSLDKSYKLREKVLNIESLDTENLAPEEILEIAIVAFEHFCKEGSELWVSAHGQFLAQMYDWIVEALDKGEISYEEVYYIERAIERGDKYFPDFWVMFSSRKDSLVFNQFQLVAHNELLDSFLRYYDSDAKAFKVTSEQLDHLKTVQEHLTTGKIEGFSGKSLHDILRILDLAYFQYDKEFSLETFKIINERDLGIRLSCGKDEIIVKLQTMTLEAAKILQNNFIGKNVFELNLSQFKTLFDDDATQTEKILKMLFRHLPSIEVLWLPVPCVLNEKNIHLLKKLKNLRTIHLDFTYCVCYNDFAKFFIPLYDHLKQKAWKLSIENIAHLGKDEAIKLFALFPESKSVSLENNKCVTDDDVMRICVNLLFLESLTLNGCTGIHNKALEHIGEYATKLQELNIQNCANVTEEGVIELLKVIGDRLLKFDVGGLKMTTVVASILADYCKNIESLSFGGCSHITDVSVKIILSECKEIRYFNLKETSVTDESVIALAERGHQLVRASFNGCEKVTGESIRTLLESCRNLEVLDIRGTAVTDAELQKLQFDFPNVI